MPPPRQVLVAVWYPFGRLNSSYARRVPEQSAKVIGFICYSAEVFLRPRDEVLKLVPTRHGGVLHESRGAGNVEFGESVSAGQGKKAGRVRIPFTSLIALARLIVGLTSF